MTVKNAERWVRKTIAALVAAFSYAIFIPVGGFFYVFLISRATISLTLASFISAMSGNPINQHVEELLKQSVSFFPTGLSIIWQVSSAIWQGEKFANDKRKYDAASLTTNVLLALIFFVVLMTLLRALGWSGFGMLAIVGWLFEKPILLMISLALVAIFIVALWPALYRSGRRFWLFGAARKQKDMDAQIT